MANSLIPYSFIPGTKAMASEVNANFIALADAVDEGKTFTTESIEKFNKELEERLDESLDSKLEANLSNSKNITNCVIELPERIKFEIKGNVFTLKAGSILTVPQGFEEDGVTPKFEYVTVPVDASKTFDSTDGGKRLVVVDTSTFEIFEMGSFTSGTSANPTTNQINYRTDLNLVKVSIRGGLSPHVFSLPIAAIVSATSSRAAYVESLFNGMGFIGQCTWVDKGVRCLYADGRNPDGTLKNFDVTSQKVTIINLSGQNSQLGQLKYYNNAINLFGYGVPNYFEQENPPAQFGQYAIWYNTRENVVYDTGDSGQTWNKTYNIVLPQLQKSTAQGSITAIKMPYAFKAADINDVLKRISAIPAVQGGSSYVKLPNNTIIQWGQTVPFGNNLTVTLPRPFAGAYTVVTTMASGNIDNHAYINTQQIVWQTPTSFAIYKGAGEATPAFWIAIGY